MGGVQAAEMCCVGGRRLRAFAIPCESVPPSVPRAAPLASPLTVLPSPILRRLSSPRVAALGCPSPWPGALRRGCWAALGARDEPWAGRVRRRVVLGVCCRGGGAKMPFVFPIRTITAGIECEQ